MIMIMTSGDYFKFPKEIREFLRMEKNNIQCVNWDLIIII